MPDDQEKQAAFEEACNDLFQKIAGEIQSTATSMLARDELTSQAPAGFNTRNLHHRDLVMWGVKTGMKAAIVAVVSYGMRDDEEEGGDEN